jgi:uncharacterized protein (DUF1800 family)
MGLSWDTLPHQIVMNYRSRHRRFYAPCGVGVFPSEKNAIISSIHVCVRVAPWKLSLTWCHTICYRKARSRPQIENNIFDELKCEVRARETRDVAPGKLVVCVGFEATAQLLRHMQGDYV